MASHHSTSRILLLAALAGVADALMLAPALRSAPLARAIPAVRMQVAEPPVKIPDKVPQFAPVEPKGDKQDEKGKKYKLLLFNDNVNRCARPPLKRVAPPPRRRSRAFAARLVRRREFVARVLVQTIPELTQADAYVVMQKAHKSGMAVVGVWVFEICEAYCEGLKKGGLIASITEEEDD